jgi:hypothetical protein
VLDVAIRRKKPYDWYRYSVPIPAVSGKHGALSIRIHLQPDGWRWELTEDDSPFRSGTKSGLEDAKSEAQYYLNITLAQKGEAEHFFSLNPDSWIGGDDEKGLGDRVRQANMGTKAKWFGSKSK